MRDPKWMEEDAFQRNEKLESRETWLSTLVVGRSGNMKLVGYDAGKLLKYGALWTMFVKGTVFNLHLVQSLLQYVFVFLGGAALLIVTNKGWEGERIGANGEVLGLVFENEIISNLEGIQAKLGKPTMFIFGLFTSLTINRWWALRASSLGILMDAVVNATAFLASSVDRKPGLTSEKRDELEQDVFKIVKLGVASVHCSCQMSRDRMDYHLLVEDELLTPDEAGILEGSSDSC